MNKTLHNLKKQVLLIALIVPFVASAQWSKPVVISPHSMLVTMTENMGPCMAASHDTLHVVWSDHRTKGYAIYYTRSIDSGLTWSNPVNITDTTGHGSDPSIAVNGRNVHVVWWDTLKGLPCSRYEHSLDGGNTWANKVMIDTNTTFWPGIAVSGSTVLVTLDKQIGSRTIVYLTKSVDNGVTFGPEQQVSSLTGGSGRSEDQSTATDGKNIYMCWNDNRNNPTVLEIYYRRSPDMGKTWDNEVQISNGASYSPMLINDSSHVYVNLGYSNPMNAYVSQSSDSGATFGTPAQVTTNVSKNAEAYPFMICSGNNLFLTTHRFPGYPWQTWYTQSSDRGATWSNETLLGNCKGTSFLALTCPAIHAVWPDSNVIYYSRNANGSPSCPSSPTSVNNITEHGQLAVYPNPVEGIATITFTEDGQHHAEVYDIAGRQLMSFDAKSTHYTWNTTELLPGMYFVKVTSSKGTQTVRFIKG